MCCTHGKISVSAPLLLLLQGMEPRVIKAASEVTAKGYAKITLLGDPQQVTAEAKKLGADISGCSIVDPKVCKCRGERI
jgi:phosphotransacetylase